MTLANSRPGLGLRCLPRCRGSIVVRMNISKPSSWGIVLLICYAAQASAQETKIKWFGHASFSITTPNGKDLLIDPWLKNPLNPEAKDGVDALAAVPKG